MIIEDEMVTVILISEHKLFPLRTYRSSKVLLFCCPASSKQSYLTPHAHFNWFGKSEPKIYDAFYDARNIKINILHRPLHLRVSANKTKLREIIALCKIMQCSTSSWPFMIRFSILLLQESSTLISILKKHDKNTSI